MKYRHQKKYRVVQLSSVHATFDTRIFHKISKSLAAHGYDVDLIIQHTKNEIVDGVNIHALPVNSSKLKRLFITLPVLFIKAIQYPSSTIFHFHDPEILPLGFLLKWFGYKVIYDVHEDVPLDIKSKDWVPAIIRGILGRLVTHLELAATRKLDGVIVVAENVLERLDSPKTYMVQNFPILSSFNGSDHEYKSDGNLFYVGDITRIRGAEEMVKVSSLVNEKYSRKLVLAGKFSPPSLKNELESMEEWNETEFIGWISREELRSQMNVSSLGFMLLYPEPNHMRSQPNKLFEYMSGKIPVISANLPRYSEIVTKHNCGLLVNPKDIDEIKKAVCWILDHPDEAKAMGERGRQAVLSEYNWENELKNLLNLYSSFEA